MDEILRQIGRRLYDRRKQLNMTQDKLAELAGVTGQTISIAELGKKAMRADTIIRICGALEISADYLLFGDISLHDASALIPKVSQLSPAQYRYLEDIINSFISAVSLNEK